METIQFICPYCKKVLICQDTLLGQTITCPLCNKKIYLQMSASPFPGSAENQFQNNTNQNKKQTPGNNSPEKQQLSQKNRVLYLIFGISLGAFGVHNFYAGYVETAKKQMIISIIATACLMPFPIMFFGYILYLVSLMIAFFGFLGVWGWAIYDVITKDCDASGRKMRNANIF